MFGLIFMKFRKLKSLHRENKTKTIPILGGKNCSQNIILNFWLTLSDWHLRSFYCILEHICYLWFVKKLRSVVFDSEHVKSDSLFAIPNRLIRSLYLAVYAKKTLCTSLTTDVFWTSPRSKFLTPSIKQYLVWQ